MIQSPKSTKYQLCRHSGLNSTADASTKNMSPRRDEDEDGNGDEDHKDVVDDDDDDDLG